MCCSRHLGQALPAFSDSGRKFNYCFKWIKNKEESNMGKQECHCYDRNKNVLSCVLHWRQKQPQTELNIKFLKSAFKYRICQCGISGHKPWTLLWNRLCRTLIWRHRKREVEVLPLRFLDGLVFHFLFTLFYHGA